MNIRLAMFRVLIAVVGFTAIMNLTAIATNEMRAPVYPIITCGRLDIQGIASDADDSTVWHQVLLYKADGTLVANLTPNAGSNGYRTGGDDGGSLVTNVDLTLYENGVYDIVLNVFDGWDVSSDTARILLDSQLKIGQFSFSVEDLTIPVGGMPLTVVRTYNSFNRGWGDFGHSWTYAIHDVNLEIDEIREDTAEVSGNEAGGGKFSLRVGGGRDVTLNLPDGRRVTFQFYFDGPRSCGYDNDPYCYFARWKAPPGVFAKIAPLGGDLSYNALTRKWIADGMSGFENFDIPGFILETQDGTKYTIEREDLEEHFFLSGHNDDFYAHTYGKGRLTQVEQLDGNKIKIEPNSIQHIDPLGNPTRSVRFERDDQGRITATHDPNSESDGLPAVQYEYDPNTGNLVEVRKLVDRSAGLAGYESTFYRYEDSRFPHYLTSIVDPRGVRVAKTHYYPDGRIWKVEDADGAVTEFLHDTTNKVEIITDRLNQRSALVYDLRGNVTATTNALGGVTLADYNDLNLKTNEVQFLDGQPYATNRFSYDLENGWRLASCDPLGHSNVFTYNQYGEVRTSVDARGFGVMNLYDDHGRLTNTVDALGHGSTVHYDDRGRLEWLSDALGTVVTNTYDDFGNLTASATLAPGSGAILSSNTFGYDANGNQVRSVAWRRSGTGWEGATNRSVLDGQGRVIESIDPLGGAHSVVYDAAGRQERTIDKLGRVTEYVHDKQGRLVRTVYPDGTASSSSYDAAGRVAYSTNQAAQVTQFHYDPLGRQTNVIYPDLTQSVTYYDQLGRVRCSVDARGVTNAFGYDRAGRRVASTNAWGTPLAAWTMVGMDANGNQIAVTNVSGVKSVSHYDALNRVTNVAYADGTATWTVYDPAGRRVAETNQDNIATLFGYDAAGKLTSVTNALGTTNQMVTCYAYDEMGNQVAQIDALGRTNRYQYNLLGQRVARWLADGTNVEQFAYDPAGNMIRHTNFNGVVITNKFDIMNRLVARASTNGYSIDFTYTLAGQRQSMIDPSGVTSYEYDSRGRLRLKTTAHAEGPELALRYAYDASGNLTNIWSATTGGVNLRYEYDALNRVTNVLSAGVQATGYGFDANGNLQSIAYGNGVTNTYQYDVLNRLTNLVWKSNAVTLASFAYGLGKTGSRTNLTETLITSVTNRSYAWTYDKLYRLTSETISGFGVATYAHDTVGNRTNRESSMSGVGSATSSYSTNDWLATDTYDKNGNTLWSTNGAAVCGEYVYDVENRLTSINNGMVQFVYDGDGVRVAKRRVSSLGGLGNATNSVYYLVDDRNPTGYGQVLEEHQAGGVRVSGYGLALISQREPSGTNFFFVSDGHGNTRLLLDAGGNVANAFAYDAYGTLIASNTTPQTAHLYCGEEFDPDLGFYNLRARYYNPQVGRFWTMDTFKGRPKDPLSLHKYLYCHGNPVDGTDPSGKAVYKLKYKSSFPLIDHRVIVGDTGTNYTGSCYVLEFWGNDGVLRGSQYEPFKWARWYYTKYEKSALEVAHDLIRKAGHGEIVTTVSTSIEVDVQLNEEASELDHQPGMWIAFYNDCGTGANLWLKEALTIQNRQHPSSVLPFTMPSLGHNYIHTASSPLVGGF